MIILAPQNNALDVRLIRSAKSNAATRNAKRDCDEMTADDASSPNHHAASMLHGGACVVVKRALRRRWRRARSRTTHAGACRRRRVRLRSNSVTYKIVDISVSSSHRNYKQAHTCITTQKKRKKKDASRRRRRAAASKMCSRTRGHNKPTRTYEPVMKIMLISSS